MRRRHRKRITRKEMKRQKKILILSFLSFTLLLSIGYAAFQTTINLNITGNIKYKTSNTLKSHTVTSGDGLYIDTYENGRYIYRGANPNNYITFNNELWRIISIESDGSLKIIRNDSIGKYAFDEVGNRDSSTSTFCKLANTYGCSAWAANSNLVGSPEIFRYYRVWSENPSIVFSGTVKNDSSLNIYLNNTYYNSISNKHLIVSGNFYVGSPGAYIDTDSIENNLKQEKEYIWNGFVGLANATEWLQSCTNSTCTTIYSSYQNNCYTNNWLVNGLSEWTISPEAQADSIWALSTYSSTNYSLYGGARVIYTRDVRPVIFLKSGLKFKNNGTKDNSYVIVS